MHFSTHPPEPRMAHNPAPTTVIIAMEIQTVSLYRKIEKESEQLNDIPFSSFFSLSFIGFI